MQAGLTIPRATYRLQFHGGYKLQDALECVPYLDALGVSHVYASPLLMARPGSTHGYDVCQPGCINPELGTEADFEALISVLRERGMGLVLDIVPNHQGIGGRENPWWWDVLKHGRQSRFADYFDIDWESPDARRHGKVLLPVLGDTLERVLERRELAVAREAGEVVVRYFDRRFPVNPLSLLEFGASSEIRLEEMHGDGQALDRLLSRQHYELAWWRQGDTDLNYRRFFTITDLVGMRVELPQVFAHTHQLILDWHRRGMLDGLRVDHPDGLRDPGAYLEQLSRSAPRAWIVVEKILEPGEELPSEWPVAGTTGYDFLGRLTAMFVDPAGERPLTDYYARFTGEVTEFATLVREKKRWILRERLGAEVARLTRILSGVISGDDQGLAFTTGELRDALVELAACVPVYRTYIRADEPAENGSKTPEAGGAVERLREADVAVIETAVGLARRESPELAPALGFLGDLLLGRVRRGAGAEFVMRFQQLTGPAMAKGVEDTAFYCYNRFVALNEVGGDPAEFGVSVGKFHHACDRARQHWPHAMLASSTHDTKRSEDVRARLAVLSEMPERWASAVQRWSAMNERHRRSGWPDRNVEYHFYQTVVGAWPVSVDRALAYVQKAAREAGQHTNWIDPNTGYETALRDFVDQTLSDPGFISALEQFLAPLVGLGRLNALSQTLLKLTAPGVPDLYQGTEAWDLSLVDPDNRRPVDFAVRREALETIRRRIEQGELTALASEVLENSADGRIKLFVIHRILQYRRQQERLFREGQYVPLAVTGSRSEHAGAFARTHEGATVVVVVPRLVFRLADGRGGQTHGAEVWGDTGVILPRTQAGRQFHNVFTDERVVAREEGAHVSLRLADLFARFPVALGELLEPPGRTVACKASTP